MLPVDEAQQRILDEVSVVGSVNTPFAAALGGVLREDIVTSRDVPPDDNSAMDGYAVIAADTVAASDASPVALRVAGEAAAGTVSQSVIRSGEAVRIMTGALIPAGADAVVQVEWTDAGTDIVSVRKGVASGVNIRRSGEDVRAGEVVLRSGTIISAAEVGVLAMLQRRLVRVSRKVTVAIMSTGDELIDVDATLTRGKVANSNAYALAALALEQGAEPRILPIVRDSKADTIAAFEKAAGSDFVVTSGGVSVGAYDFVKDALEALGAETHFWRVAMKPGKPVVFARLGEQLCFGLPGNPVSCMVTFHLLVAPAIRKASGRSGVLPPTVWARLTAPLRGASDRASYQRVHVTSRDGRLHAQPMRAQGSGVLTSMVGANGLAVLEAGTELLEAGADVPTILIGRI